jgi:phenylacetic acid degradation operon negative regulatory protein
MMPASAAPAALEALIDRLHERGRLRVWSLVITVFGDAVAPRGGRIALGTLQAITTRLRIEPGALRTALSRLASDGWVTRERDGRNSYYRLADRGRHSFDLATRRIYAAGHPAWKGGWTVMIAAPGNGGAAAHASQLLDAGFVQVAPGTFLRPDTAAAPDPGPAPEAMLVLRATAAQFPADISAYWKLDALAVSYRTFIGAFAPLGEALETTSQLRPLDAMAARTLLIHEWRRIVLHDPALPDALLPSDWPGNDARMLARRIYGAVVGPSERWLDDAGLPELGDHRGFNTRFGAETVGCRSQSR